MIMLAQTQRVDECESRSAEVDERNHCSEHNSKSGRSSAGTRIAVDVFVWVRSPFAARLAIFRKKFRTSPSGVVDIRAGV